ncbi:hypothetical protein XENOCAPTIV_021744 [Xenoophorus captivus]|uniref:ABC transmembrane type-1 domain-containing protein n=1 Tax=Xenoophorus captivus TaxID=1517983 RepID=A0ABV0R1I3_9TELE
MAEKAVTTIHKVALIVAVCVDLSLFYGSGLVVIHSVLGHFAHLWLSAALRWSAITGLTLLFLGDLSPLLIRFITAYSLLPAVFETGTRALYREESQCGPVADIRCWLMFAGASLGAALFWEIIIPDSDEEAGNKEQKQKSRVLFMRVLHLYKPDYPLLFGGVVLSKDTTLTGRTVCLNVNVLLRTFIKTMGMISLMMSLSWKLTFLVLMETPITGLIQNIYDTHYQEMQNSMARTNDAANEVVFGIRVVRSFNTEKHEAVRYDKRLIETQSLKTRRDIVGAIYLLARRVFILYYGRLFIQMGQMTTGNLVSFIIYQSDLGDNIRVDDP